ncbi:hypothetical protein EMPS_07962 [Entomortierella parvispora]|uniref:Crinkler effector protein N-terminal domain-containing protein n=1 Tax=Entomortierella parvispora TaxID=205924 RepID=A0A9P3HF65_9FUNG|nr:hypothetical protein EMPS_07962 [Entomortierella parvispora]
MEVDTLTFFCLISGELLSTAFPVEASSSKTVGALKKAVFGEKTNAFEHIDANDLILWRATIPIDKREKKCKITADALEDKTELDNPRTRLSELFPESPDENTYIFVERPKATSTAQSLELEALRKQLSEMEDSSISLGFTVKPEKKVAFTWSTIVDEAILDDLKSKIIAEYPQYAQGNLEIFVYSGQSKPESIRHDSDLRRILRIAKKSRKTNLSISLETPTKSFGLWKFKDVCTEYQLSLSDDPGLEVIPPFTGVKAAPLDSDLEKKILAQLTDDVESMVDTLNLVGANEATKSMIVGSFLVKVTRLFKEDLFLAAERTLSGRRGNGPVDYSVHSRDDSDFTLGVTEVKKEDFVQGVAQNIVQLEAALTSKKRKRGRGDVDGEEELLTQMRSYGIVTDASQWLLIECTMNGYETVSYRMTGLGRIIDYSSSVWKDDAKFIFQRLVWLWSKMKDEIPARGSHSRKSSSPPSIRTVSV